jgi:hypothetical protein
MTMEAALIAVMTAIMIFFLVINSFQAFLLMCSVPELWAHWQLMDDEYFHALVDAQALPPVSVVAALHSANDDSVAFAQMLLGLNYPRFEVILVTDGATGTLLSEMQSAFDLYEVPPAFTINLKTGPVSAYYRSRSHPRLLCLDKRSSVLADSLNAALNAARYPHVVSAATNVVFDPNVLLHLTRPFLLDRSVVCVGGIPHPASHARARDGSRVRGPVRGWAMGCHAVAHLRDVTFQRLGWNCMASNIVFPGGTVLFRREDIFGLGGFDASAEMPEIDVAIRLPKYLTDIGVNGRMPVIPDRVGRSVAPSDLASTGRACQSWTRDLRRGLASHASMVANPEYGAFGMIVLPYLWLGIIIAPFLELLGYAGLALGLLAGILDASFTWSYLAAVVGYGILLSVWTVVFQAVSFRWDGQAGGTARLLAYAVIESLGYRQLLALYRTSAYFAERQPKHTNGQSSPTGAT